MPQLQQRIAVRGRSCELRARVQQHLDEGSIAIVDSCVPLSGTVGSPKMQPHRRTVTEVAPPELALGPEDRDRQAFGALFVGDRERVLSAGTATSDGYEG
jgi:hypothetical protein